MKIGERIVRVETCTSTNDLAHEMALQGEREGTVIMAEEQRRGRGTKGRQWYSPAGKGLYFSVILRPRKRDLSLLPMAMGLAVREALLESEGLSARLKWPNDIVCSGKKLGGLLCEASFRGNEANYVALGVGINVNQTQDDFPEEFRKRATSLRLQLHREIDRENFLSKLCRILDDWYNLFLQRKDAQIIRIFEECSAFSAGEKIMVGTEKERIVGEYRGVDLQGRLILRVEKGERSFLAAEVMEIKK